MGKKVRTTIRGRALLGNVDSLLSKAQDAVSDVVTSEMASYDLPAYELGSDLYRQLEAARRRIYKLTIG